MPADALVDIDRLETGLTNINDLLGSIKTRAAGAFGTIRSQVQQVVPQFSAASAIGQRVGARGLGLGFGALMLPSSSNPLHSQSQNLQGLYQFQAAGKGLEHVSRAAGQAVPQIKSLTGATEKLGKLFGEWGPLKTYTANIELLEKAGGRLTTTMAKSLGVMKPLFSGPAAVLTIAVDQMNQFRKAAVEAEKELHGLYKTSQLFEGKGTGIAGAAGAAALTAGTSRREAARGFIAGQAAGFTPGQTSGFLQVAAAMAREQGKQLSDVLTENLGKWRQETLGLTRQETQQYIRRLATSPMGIAGRVAPARYSVGAAMEDVGTEAGRFGRSFNRAARRAMYAIPGIGEQIDPYGPSIFSRISGEIRGQIGNEYDLLRTSIGNVPGLAVRGLGSLFGAGASGLDWISGQFGAGRTSDQRMAERRRDQVEGILGEYRSVQGRLGAIARTQSRLQGYADMFSHENRTKSARQRMREANRELDTASRSGDQGAIGRAWRKYLVAKGETERLNAEAVDPAMVKARQRFRDEYESPGLLSETGRSLLAKTGGVGGFGAFLAADQFAQILGFGPRARGREGMEYDLAYAEATRRATEIQRRSLLKHPVLQFQKQQTERAAERGRVQFIRKGREVEEQTLQRQERLGNLVLERRGLEGLRGNIFAEERLKDLNVQIAATAGITGLSSTNADIRAQAQQRFQELLAQAPELSLGRARVSGYRGLRARQQILTQTQFGQVQRRGGFTSEELQEILPRLQGRMGTADIRTVQEFIQAAQQRRGVEVEEVMTRRMPQMQIATTQSRMAMLRRAGIELPMFQETGPEKGLKTILQRGAESEEQIVQEWTNKILDLKEQAFQRELQFTTQYTQAKMKVIQDQYQNEILLTQARVGAADVRMAPAARLHEGLMGLHGITQSLYGAQVGELERSIGAGRTREGFAEAREGIIQGALGFQMSPAVALGRQLRGLRRQRRDYERQQGYERQQALMTIQETEDTIGRLQGAGIQLPEYEKSSAGRRNLIAMYSKALPAYERYGIGGATREKIQELKGREEEFLMRRYKAEQQVRGLERTSIEKQIGVLEKGLGKEIFETPEGKIQAASLAGKYREAMQIYASQGEVEKAEEMGKKYEKLVGQAPEALRSVFEGQNSVTNTILTESQKTLKDLLTENRQIVQLMGGTPGTGQPDLVEGVEKTQNANTTLQSAADTFKAAADQFANTKLTISINSGKATVSASKVAGAPY